MAADGFPHGDPYGSMTIAGAQARTADATPVLIFPGFTKDGVFMDDFARQLAANLDDAYDVRNWAGPTVTGATRAVLKHARDKLLNAFDGSGGQKVTIIGHSFGGVLARELAREFPDMVGHIVTLGTPVRDFNITAAAPLYLMYQGLDRLGEQMRIAADYRVPTSFHDFFSTAFHNMGVANRQLGASLDQGMHHPDILARVADPIDGVHITAVWSETDQLVPDRMARVREDGRQRNVTVKTRGDEASLVADHFELVQSPDIIRAVAQAVSGHAGALPAGALAQPAGIGHSRTVFEGGQAPSRSRGARLVAEAV